MLTNSQFPVDLVTFIKEIFNIKLHFLCSVTIFLINPRKQTHAKNEQYKHLKGIKYGLS